ncbi:hypothetical protein CL617_03285 [archaeon]|nr:hypothetical protein [archaeon]|tara:strand:- start:1802 stop:2644 length:843 start_codon:yes stop_codon:yes gene_type:complete
MYKKGFLFTIISLAILLSILVFSIAYLDRVKEFDKLDTVNILRYYEDDIVSNVFNDLYNIEVKDIKRSGSVIVNFSKFGIYKLDKDLNLIRNNYRTFVGGRYSELNNINVSFSNFLNEFKIKEYNSSFIIRNSNFTMSNENYDFINGIEVDIVVNQTFEIDDSEQPSQQDPEDPLIHVRVLRESGVVIYDQSINQGSEESNNPFRVSFKTEEDNDVSEVSFEYGILNEINGEAFFYSSNLEARITRFEVNYDDIGSKVVIDSESLVKINDKESKIILGQE